jgi:hypothetical protein
VHETANGFTVTWQKKRSRKNNRDKLIVMAHDASADEKKKKEPNRQLKRNSAFKTVFKKKNPPEVFNRGEVSHSS